LVRYDQSFDANEIFVLIVTVIGYLAVYLARKQFSLKMLLICLLFGIYTGFFFDHTISLYPMNYYDVNEVSKFELFDFISYVMYGPFSYFFIYLWEKLQLQTRHAVAYILCWSLIGLLTEAVAHKVGIYHYREGFSIFYSFTFYPIVQLIWLNLYWKLKKEPAAN
jgi:hypothetical protein